MRSAVLVLLLGCAALAAGCFEAQLELDDPAPVADAGFDQVRYLQGQPSLVVDLDGRASCDPLGNSLDAAEWRVLQAPPGAGPTISPLGTLQALFNATASGEYLIALNVVAGDRESPTDVVLIDVREGSGDDVVVGPPVTDACGTATPF